MTNLNNFRFVESLVAKARAQYNAHAAEKRADIDTVFTLLCDIVNNIHNLYSEEQLKDSQVEAALFLTDTRKKKNSGPNKETAVCVS